MTVQWKQARWKTIDSNGVIKKFNTTHCCVKMIIFEVYGVMVFDHNFCYCFAVVMFDHIFCYSFAA